MDVMRAAAHGAYVAATGDTTRLRTIRRQTQAASIVASAWSNVGQALSRAISQRPSPTRP